MNLKTFCRREYQNYTLAKGSQHITSEFALLNILRLIKRFKAREILEIGLGIGTISGSILKYSRQKNLSLTVYGTEANEFCLEQLELNLELDYSSLRCYKNLKSLPNNIFFDFIIVDGSEPNIQEIKHKLRPRGIVVIEGDRKDQVKAIMQIFPKARYAHIISLSRNGSYSLKDSADYQGGLKVIFTNPNLHQSFHWFVLKVITKLKYYKRRYNYE